MKQNEFIICTFNKNDCFANVEDNKCNCLNKCDFRKGKCPFYKSKEQLKQELQKLRKKEGVENV